MYLKRLEIFGFKSFADKTVFNFGPGITAVIGPNGCGKSNVFDAIRWVLGEQSVKELRGSSMEDVIFNGTDKKPALGFAEVSLTFANESRVLPVAYNEVTVTRRLFRSGESEYLINKSTVRLKDITEMFMGTGVGAEAYSMVQQGKVDLVVSARPEDRRMILDEASGITKYKAKKREALNRLKNTENNLLRINDIIVEVKRQISSCERQAKKARRYKEEFEKLKVLEVRFACHNIDRCQIRKGAMDEQLNTLRERQETLITETEEFQNLIDHQTNLLEELEDKIAEVQADQIKLDGQIDIDHRQISFHEERIRTIETDLERIDQAQGQLRERCRQQEGKIVEVRSFLAGLDESVADSVNALNAKRERLGILEQGVHEAKAGIKTEEENILRVTSEQVHVKNRITENMKQMQGALARQRRLDHERAKVSTEKQDVDTRFDEICRQVDAAAARCEGLKAQRSQKSDALNQQQTKRNALDAEIQDLDRKKLSLISQKEFIEKLSAQYDDIPDPLVTGSLVVDAPPQDHHTGIIGKVREVRSFQGAWPEKLTSLGPEVHKLYEVICETKFIELDPVQVSKRIEELSLRIAELQGLRTQVNAEIQSLDQGMKALEIEIQNAEKDKFVFESQKKGLSEEVEKLSEELTLVGAELEETQTALEATRNAETVLGDQLAGLNYEFETSQSKIKHYQADIQTKGIEREEISVAIAQLEAEVHSVEDRKASHQENLRIFTETLESAVSELARLEADHKRLMDDKARFENDIVGVKEHIQELHEAKTSADTQLSELQGQRQEDIQRMTGLKANVAGYQEEIEQIKETVHKQDMDQQQITFEQKEIKDRLLQSYRINLDDSESLAAMEAAASGEISADGPMPPDEMLVMIERLRKRCDSFGSVNLVAIEEFDELKERFEFLTKQQADLLEAKESLHKMITKINRETRQMFMNTFTKVSEEFRIYFRMLFGGGEAQLVLIDPHNPLECGIDIIARPPGKKRQSISLLSGGEKTLTAIALIFGVFKVNPSPFCVLDEIDAALDESNVGRYSYLLKDFAKIAQFVVITHNKKTIANADVLYGITMQQTGVSKLVSVKLGEEEKKEGAGKEAVLTG